MKKSSSLCKKILCISAEGKGFLLRQHWYKNALLVCSLTACLALPHSRWELSLGFWPLDFELPSLKQGNTRSRWVDLFLVWLLKQSRVLGLWCITFLFLSGFGLWFLFLQLLKLALAGNEILKRCPLPNDSLFQCMRTTLKLLKVFPSPESTGQISSSGAICALRECAVDTGTMKPETCFASCCVHAPLMAGCPFLRTLRCDRFAHGSSVEMYHVHYTLAGTFQGPTLFAS